MKYNVIDLFCGAGGMSEGIIQAGLNIVFSSDINESVEKTYRNRHTQLGLEQGKNTFFLRSDIKDLRGKDILKQINNLSDVKLNDGEIDAIFGGPPCQGFSMAGRRDSSDPRNLLFKEYLRVVCEIKPKYVIMENVEGFLNMQFYGFVGINNDSYPDGYTAPEIMRDELNKIGYKLLDLKTLNAYDFGVPQRRNRVILIAYRADVVQPEYPIPLSENQRVVLEDAIGDLNNTTEKLSKYQIESIRGRTKDINGNYPNYELVKLNKDDYPNHTKVVKERFSLYKPGETTSDLKKRIKKEGIDLSKKINLLGLLRDDTGINFDEIIEKFKSGNVSSKMLDKLLTRKNIRQKLACHEPSPTILTIPDDYISPYDDRTFSVRELARIQSFDDSFEFLGKRTTGGTRRRIEVPQYTQVGNAVPPLLARAIAVEIKKALDKTYIKKN